MFIQTDVILTTLFPNQEINLTISKLENKMEDDLIKIFRSLEIHATRKSDPKSLPYQKEIITNLYSESYLNGVLEYHRCFRKIVKELIDLNIYKIRFYIEITPIKNKLEYRFRYYIH